jgi:hypothetical protein
MAELVVGWAEGDYLNRRIVERGVFVVSLPALKIPPRH